MQQPLQISFRGLDSSPAIEARVRELAGRLEQFAMDITSCHVTVEVPHRHHHQGQLYDVKIQVRLPGKEINVNREGPHDHAHEDVYVALRDAFAATARRLEDHERRRDHRTSPHEQQPHGKVIRMYARDGYGFIETDDGLDVYFHEHSVLGAGFAKLEVGDDVRLEIGEQESDKGPQATTVHPMHKRHAQRYP